MSYILICSAALLASCLTLFSGFGLGTLLLPVFALFFPLPIAVASTAVVHLANNLFKFALMGKSADWRVVARFGVPAIIGALIGAWLLNIVADAAPLHVYTIGTRTCTITPVKLLLGSIIALFAILELKPGSGTWSLPPRVMPIGGWVSGFFGGLSGHQGALRSAFLLRAGLSKDAFIATGVVCAVFIDVARLGVYGFAYYTSQFDAIGGIWTLVLAACAAAFVGSFVGARLVRKTTMRTIRLAVGVMLLLLAGALVSGVA